jgi:hypothetical protein
VAAVQLEGLGKLEKNPITPSCFIVPQPTCYLMPHTKKCIKKVLPKNLNARDYFEQLSIAKDCYA